MDVTRRTYYYLGVQRRCVAPSGLSVSQRRNYIFLATTASRRASSTRRTGTDFLFRPLPLLAARGGVKAAGSPQSIIILVTIKNVQTRRRRALASRRESASDLATSLRHQSFSVLRIVDARTSFCAPLKGIRRNTKSSEKNNGTIELLYNRNEKRYCSTCR